MRRTSLTAALVILVLGLTAVVLLKAYRLDLIQVIVENAIVQKAPPAYDERIVRQQFDADLKKARQSGRENEYLDALLRASQRLEKVQRLETEEIQHLMSDLSHAAGASLP